jgi:hypothetical protein
MLHAFTPPGAGNGRTGDFSAPPAGREMTMLWLILFIALVAIFGLGTVLEAAFWTLLIIAAVVIVVGLAIGRLIGA